MFEIIAFFFGMCAGGAVVWIFKEKAVTVASDVKKDISV